jgi:hypothetical protein
MARKTVPIKSATDPAPLRYSGKPNVPADVESRPVADGLMSTGATGGNYEQPTTNTGPGQTQQGLDITDKDL